MRASRMSVWIALAMAAAVSAAAVKVAVAQDKPSIIVTYWQQATALPETILATQPSLQATIPATITYRPITSGRIPCGSRNATLKEPGASRIPAGSAWMRISNTAGSTGIFTRAATA